MSHYPTVHRASKRALFVHIGMPKTGSTSIQALLAKWPAFLERSGVHVPVAGLTSSSGHRALFKEMPPIRPRDCDPWTNWQLDPVAWGDLQGELTRCAARRFVISSEALADGRPQSSEWAEAFAAVGREAGVDVEGLAYVRPQYEWLEAMYAHLVKVGYETRPFEACLEECLASACGTGSAQLPPIRLSHVSLDYNRVFEPWREVLGDRLKVYTLDEARRAGGLTRHFLRFIGANDLADVATGMPRLNQRLGAKFVEVLRLTSAALDTADLDVPKWLLLAKVRRELPALLQDDVPFRPLTEAQIQAVTQRYADANAQLACDYGQGAAFHSESTTRGSPRPARVEWRDIDSAERDRVRRYVLNATGVDLDTGRFTAMPGLERAASGWSSVMRGMRLFASQARSIRHPRDAVPFSRWLQWRLLGLVRRFRASA